MELLGEAETIYFRTIASAIVSIHAGENPRDVVIRARRLVGTDARPTQAELADITKGGGG
jgi:chemotaxis protein MotA